MRYFTLVCLFIAVLFLVGFDETVVPASQLLVTEIVQKYHLHVSRISSTKNITLPKQLTGPYWGLTQSVLKRTGYDLSPFAGQSVSMISYDLNEKYYQSAFSETRAYDVSLWIFAKGPRIVGAYATNKLANGPDSGIFAVNDPNII